MKCFWIGSITRVSGNSTPRPEDSLIFKLFPYLILQKYQIEFFDLSIKYLDIVNQYGYT